MRPRAFFVATACLVLLSAFAACGGDDTKPEPGENPQPGSVLKGDIAMGSDSGGVIFLSVSDDGNVIDSLHIQLPGLSESRAFADENPGDLGECLAALQTLRLLGEAFLFVPLSDGTFSVNDTGKLGVITGRFDTPTTASGTVLLLKQGTECGEWPWTAALQGGDTEVPSTTSVVEAAGGGTISGRVVGKEGPVSGALVQLSSLTDEACAAASDNGLDPLSEGQSDAEIELLHECREQVGRIPTDQDGSYVFGDLPPGLYAMWIHWEQSTAPPVPLRAVPPAGFFFVTLSAEVVGTTRVDVSMLEETLGTYEIDVNLHSFELLTDEALTKDFTW